MNRRTFVSGVLGASAPVALGQTNEMQSRSVLFSFNPRQLGTDVVLAEAPHAWQVRLRGNGLLSMITYYSATSSQSSEITQVIETDSWYQFGVAVDLPALRMRVVFRQLAAPRAWTIAEYKLVPGTFGADVRQDGEARSAIGIVLNFKAHNRAMSTTELQDSLAAATPGTDSPVTTLPSSTFPVERDGSVQLPEASDVAMSSRWWYPRKPDDSQDTLRDLAAFHATRLEWIYDAAPQHIRAVKDAGLAFCTTINASDDVKGRPYSARNFDGGVAFFAWMASWRRDGDPIGACCLNNERFRAHHREVIEAAVRAGAAGVQFDDWGSNVALARNNGECFCEFCLRKFRVAKGVDYRAELKTHGVADLRAYFEYRTRRVADPLQRAYVEFQAESVRDYLGELKQFLTSLTRQGGKRASLSINANFSRLAQDNRSMVAANLVDYFVGEGGDESLAGMFINARFAELQKRRSIFSPFPYKVDVTRSEIALQYALGQLCLVPYDVWMHTSDVPRYYGRPEDYADLFAFVREHKAMFDGASTVATVGIELPRSDESLRPLVTTLVERNIPFRFSEPRARIRIGAQQTTLTADQMREAAILEVEPSGVVALPRAGERITAVHLVNRNNDELSRMSVLRDFGVRLLQPAFWGPIRQVELLAPGAAPRVLRAESFGRGMRIAVPELKTWAVLRIS